MTEYKTKYYACGLGMTIKLTLPSNQFPEDCEVDYWQTYIRQIYITGDKEQAKNRTMIISFNDYINS